MRKSIRIVLLMAAFVAAIMQAGAQAISFSLTEVGASWQYCKPQGINANGQVVGYTDPINGAQHAFLWDNANPIRTFQDLGPGVAKGINNSGQVVGGSPAPPYGFLSAFLWDSVHGMQNIGSTFGVLASQANAINRSGQVVGYLATSEYFHPFLWDGANGMQDRGTLAGGRINFAYGINDSGQVVGESGWADGAPHAFLWNGACAGPGLFCTVPAPPYDNVYMHDLGPGWATGINNNVSMNGEIGPIAPMAGAAQLSPTVTGAVLWKVVCCVSAGGYADTYLTSSTPQDLGGGLSVATGIN